MLAKIEDLYDYFSKRERKFGMNFGLERMNELLEEMNADHSSLKYVHFAGTNGKGSTLHFLKKILVEAGYRVGTFTSPHIETVQERIMINDAYIAEEDFLRLFNEVIHHVDRMEGKEIFPTQFEILTVIALLYFEEQKPDIVLMETGLGGRLDSTNVIQPLLSVITTVSIDHTNVLGTTLEEIAFEKAGIIKQKADVITGVDSKEALDVIREKSKDTGSRLFVLGEDFLCTDRNSLAEGESFAFRYQKTYLEDLRISMIGRHQTNNAALAVMTAIHLNEEHGFNIGEKQIRTGLKQANWKGRLETMSAHPTVIVDGSHNEEGVKALVDTIERRFPESRRIFVLATLADKENDKMVSCVESAADRIIFTEFEAERAITAEKLASFSNTAEYKVIPDWRKAVEEGLGSLSEEDVLIVTGSLYFLYYTRPFIRNKLSEK